MNEWMKTMATKKNNNNNIDNIQASLSSLYDRSTHDNDDWELSTKQKRKKNFSELGKKKNHNNSNWTILIEFFYLKKHLFHDNDLNTIRLLMNMNLNRKFWFDSTKKNSFIIFLIIELKNFKGVFHWKIFSLLQEQVGILWSKLQIISDYHYHQLLFMVA